ncbi:MAG: TIGR04282 family arsenosugar biosynthesis glycosyltransferase [Cyclobacteriaceae bacterium]
MTNSTLIIFVKNPIPGRVKTRLAKDIGDEKAVWVYRKLLECTADVIRPLSFSKAVWYGDHINDCDLWDGLEKYQQPEGNLGYRMKFAFEQSFEQSKKVCIIGSDCPQLSTEILEEAFSSLDKHDFVIGPAIDGGYYLLGMSSFTPSIFESVEWSTSQVFEQTIARIKTLGASYHTLEELRDIDDMRDVDALGLIIP